MEAHYKALKLYLLHTYPICEVCGIRQATQVGHCIKHRMKNHPELDCVQNCQSNCPECNTGYGNNANSHDAKVKHWNKRNDEGYQMRKWMDSLPMIAKEYFGE